MYGVTECANCDNVADARFDAIAYNCPGDDDTTFDVHFCSHKCANAPFVGCNYDGTFKCPDCAHYVAGIYKSGYVMGFSGDCANWYWSGSDDHDATDYSCCKTCYIARVLKHGDTSASLTNASVNAECRSWLTEAMVLAAGYVLREHSVDPWKVKPVCHVLQSADASFIVMYDTVMLMASRWVPSRIYARPNGKRARSVALMLCATTAVRRKKQRVCNSSTLDALPRELVRLLAQAVYDTRFEQEWLF